MHYGKEYFEIDTSFLEGKTDEELTQICVDYLGDIKETYPNDPYSSYFPQAISDDLALHNLAHRIGEDRAGLFDRKKPLDDDTLRALEHDFGFSAVHSDRESLLSLVRPAFRKEALAIMHSGISKDREHLYQERASREEIERRVKFILSFYSKKQIERFLKGIMPRFYYQASLEEINADFEEREKKFHSTNGKLDAFESKVLPFLDMIDIFMENGVNLEDFNIDWREYSQGGIYSLLEVYERVKHNFSDCIKDMQREANQSTDLVSSENNVTVNATSSDDYISDAQELLENEELSSLTIEKIQRQIEENNKTIISLLAKNQSLVSQLATLQNVDKVEATK